MILRDGRDERRKLAPCALRFSREFAESFRQILLELSNSHTIQRARRDERGADRLRHIPLYTFPLEAMSQHWSIHRCSADIAGDFLTPRSWLSPAEPGVQQTAERDYAFERLR